MNTFARLLGLPVVAALALGSGEAKAQYYPVYGSYSAAAIYTVGYGGGWHGGYSAYAGYGGSYFGAGHGGYGAFGAGYGYGAYGYGYGYGAYGHGAFGYGAVSRSAAHAVGYAGYGFYR